ncbi:MAG TPA: class E sortase [Rubrobacter sp.]|nr:class E sortase [Rubrobacter sp.]
MLREIRRRLAEDPLLKVGVVAMTFALALTGVAALIVFLEGSPRAVAENSSKESTLWPLARSDPDTNWRNWGDASSPRTSPEPGTRYGESGSGTAQDQSRQSLPLDEYDYPLPTDQQLGAANQPRHYNLPPGAIMSLSINTLGLNNVPVLSSSTTRALDQGVIHLPGTSYPWSDTLERNVYLAGHRLGWPGTGSHLVFYRLNELSRGDRVTLRDREGRRYDYMVIESFEVGPFDRWVTGRVRGRDLLTLQTCTPIPTFEKRLIVRAERI